MVRVQTKKFRYIWFDEVMDYHQVGSSDSSSVRGEHKITIQPGMKRIVPFILYSILLLLVLILLTITGIKFSQLNKEITDIKLYLETISHGGKTSSASSDAINAQDIYFQRLAPVRGTCREGWVSFQKSCYLLSTMSVTWGKAEERCQTHGGHLVVLNNVEELDYISQISEVQHSYWIGLVEREHDGHWSWVDGTDFSSTPTFWDEGQPDDWDFRENGEDCGQIHASQSRSRRLWNDADCNLPYRYICETRL